MDIGWSDVPAAGESAGADGEASGGLVRGLRHRGGADSGDTAGERQRELLRADRAAAGGGHPGAVYHDTDGGERAGRDGNELTLPQQGGQNILRACKTGRRRPIWHRRKLQPRRTYRRW